MSGSIQLRIKQYFGLSKLQEMTLSLEDARGYLKDYWPNQNVFGVKVYIEGKVIGSYDELVEMIFKDNNQDKGTIEVGIYQTTSGK